MTQKSVPGSEYPPDWKVISKRVKDAAGWCCVRCGHPDSYEKHRVLTPHHLDMDRGNCVWWNIPALCQVCHLQIQNKVVLHRPYVMLPHTPWFRSYVAGYYAWRYLGIDLTREEVDARLDELLDLERQAILGATGD